MQAKGYFYIVCLHQSKIVNVQNDINMQCQLQVDKIEEYIKDRRKGRLLLPVEIGEATQT